MDSITSLKNPLVVRLRALKDAPARSQHGQMLIEGRIMIREALDAGLTPRTALIARENVSRDAELIRSLEAAGARAFEAPEAVLASVCPTKTPQGECCAFDLIAPRKASALGARLAALDGVQDPGNVGTIWRTADAAGLTGLLLGPLCAGATSPKVVRAAMGSAFRLPYGETGDLAETLTEMRAAGYDVVVSALDGEDVYARKPLGDKWALVIGSEARGASEKVKACATHRVKLPMRGGAESLNAAVAAGILMYELTRGL